ncbi:MAG: hypothetical protein JXJ30_10870 [Halothiobacillaceae bacterium]|nr:hypothetical protein [Halothiobacillaceae bacterium]
MLANLGLAQWLSGRPDPEFALVLLALLPLAGIVILSIAPRLDTRRTVLLAALAGAVAPVLAMLIGDRLPLYYLSQHLAVHLALAGLFLGSLRAGHEPVCTRLAAQVHDQLSPSLRHYTRRITWAWGLFFVANGAMSIGLMIAFGPSLWTVYAMYATLPLVATLFVVEYLVRLQVLPREECSGPIAAIQAYRRHMLRLTGDRE